MSCPITAGSKVSVKPTDGVVFDAQVQSVKIKGRDDDYVHYTVVAIVSVPRE